MSKSKSKTYTTNKSEKVNVYDLVNADVVVMDEVAVNKLEEVLK